MRNFKRILVVRTDRIGDVVLTTPSLQSLRVLYPEAKIDLLVSPLTKALVVGNPSIDKVIVDDRQGLHKGFLGFFRLVRGLRRRKYELAIIFHTKKRTNSLCFFAGIPMRLGYKNNKFGFLLTCPVDDRRVEGKKHEAQYCLDLLKEVPGFSRNFQDILKLDKFKLYVSISEKSKIWRKNFFLQNNIDKNDHIIAIHPGASDPAKRCSEIFFSQLINSLIKKYDVRIILIGAKDIMDISNKIISSIAFEGSKHQKVIDLTGLTSLEQLVSLLAKCSLLISNDSGPVHIASGVSTPSISIFTRNQPGINPTRWRPLNSQSSVISVPFEEKYLKTGIKERHLNYNNQSGSKDQELQDFITVEGVLEEVDSIFKLC